MSARRHRPVTGWLRRTAAAGSIGLAVSLGVTALNPGTTAAVCPTSATASGVATVVQNVMRAQHLKAVIVKITQGNRVVADQAFGPSVTGVPATTAMHFRNGAVAFA